ncbi:MAG: hypothetical protein AAF671_05790 [Pseudomonadota bacterium]
MLSISAEPDNPIHRIAPLTSNREILIALAVSVLLHVCFVYTQNASQLATQKSSLQSLQKWRDQGSRADRTKKLPIEVMLGRVASRKKDEPVIQAKPRTAEAEGLSASPATPVPSVERTRSMEQSLGRSENDSPDETSRQPAMIVDSESSASLITTLEGLGLRESPGSNCDSRERASQIRVCNSGTGLALAPRKSNKFEGQLDEAFRTLSRSPTFRGDMRKIETLRAKQAQLELIAGRGGPDSLWLQREQQAIRDEIHRIDAQYASVNLLKVMGEGAKVTKRLIKAAADRNR